MVMHHVHSKIHELRQRPREDREVIASLIAVGVVVILLIGWVIFFARGVARSLPHTPEGSGAIKSDSVVTPSDSSSQNDQGVPTPVSKILVGGAASTTPMNDAAAQDTVKALMQIANGQ